MALVQQLQTIQFRIYMSVKCDNTEDSFDGYILTQPLASRYRGRGALHKAQCGSSHCVILLSLVMVVAPGYYV